MLKILTVVIVTFAPLTDVTFGYGGQPKLFEHLDFGISMESRGMDETAVVYSCLRSSSKKRLMLPYFH